jgi:hypothetical protein
MHNHWVSELRPTSGVLKLENTTLRKLHLVPSSGEGKETLRWVP